MLRTTPTVDQAKSFGRMAAPSLRKASGGSAGGANPELQRYPSSVAGSYRSSSVATADPERSMWSRVRESLVK